MSDDIVTKLEFLLKEGAEIIKEQAAEIERLRAEVAYLKQGWYPTPATVQSYPWWRKEWS